MPGPELFDQAAWRAAYLREREISHGRGGTRAALDNALEVLADELGERQELVWFLHERLNPLAHRRDEEFERAAAIAIVYLLALPIRRFRGRLSYIELTRAWHELACQETIAAEECVVAELAPTLLILFRTDLGFEGLHEQADPHTTFIRRMVLTVFRAVRREIGSA